MLLLWLFLVVSFFLVSDWLLITLLLVEAIAFILLLFVAVSSVSVVLTDYYLLSLFSVFVIEGVIGLSGMIYLVRFTGSDYLSSSSILLS